ncbi:hypothetical protein FDV58_36320 [Bradyrhizobium elkanii]|uniref:Uncharacterized protein n=1 Tax=Bradyrhizobium elkanii TaxID=29448 RepID=A0A4U6RH83_BRAEL|nr:hypothetical protein [Bradyrhizobium elkanii]TKV73677.1 hypothetical protein FDV58_36320 [Bradyrhizobium elkanii]
MPVTLKNHTQDANTELLDENFPPVPAIPSLNHKPPLESEKIVLGTSSSRIKIWADSDNSSMMDWVDDIPGSGDEGRSRLLQYWNGQPPAEYKLTHRQFWRQVDGSYTRLPEGNSKTIKYTKTFGISATDSETISAELGVDAGSLKSKLSSTFSHSVTTSTQVSQEMTESIEAPKAGKIRVWMAWQLCDEIVALDRNGNLIAAGDQGSANRRADVSWMRGIFVAISGAWVYYKSARAVFPSDTIINAQADFDAVR